MRRHGFMRNPEPNRSLHLDLQNCTSIIWFLDQKKKEAKLNQLAMLLQDHRVVEYASKGFRLPKGWRVEKFPRKNSNHIDKVTYVAY